MCYVVRNLWEDLGPLNQHFAPWLTAHPALAASRFLATGDTQQANTSNQIRALVHFILLYGCAKLHFTDLAQTLAHAFGPTSAPWDDTRIIAARANL
jgi:hypothetical protein